MFRYLRVLALLLISLIPGLALADGLSLTPPASDLSVTLFLNPIFGALVPGGGGGDAMASVIGKFNAGVLLVGGILLSYGIIAGTMQTAHDGEVLGRRWSSMWMPIRTSIGVAAIVPMGSGYSVIQFLVMWIVVQGVGLADTLWSAYNKDTNAQVTLAMNASSEKAAATARGILISSLCNVMLKSGAADDKAAAAARGDTLAAPENDPFGFAATATVSDPVCGSVNMPKEPKTAIDGNGWAHQTFGSLDIDKKMYAAHKAALSSLQTTLEPLATKIYASDNDKATAALTKDYNSAVSTYLTALNNAAQSAASSGDSASGFAEMAARASQDGWAVAGAWYMKFIRVQNMLTSAVNQFPTVIKPNEEKLGIASTDSKWYGLVKKFNTVVNSSSYTAGTTGLDKENQAMIQADSADESWSTIFSWISDRVDLSRHAQTLLKNTNAGDNPLLSVVVFGNKIFNSGIAIIGIMLSFFVLGSIANDQGGVAAKLASKVVKAFTSSDTILSALIILMPLVMTLVGVMLGWGGILAFYIPMIPFIIWIGVVIGWLILVVEAVIAAPLWAVMHIHPDADGVAGRGGQGYNLVLSLALRPALAIIGLIAAMVLMYPLGKFIIDIFWSAWNIAMNNDTGIFVGVAGVVIFANLLTSVIKQVFSLAHVIPDKLLRWVGGDTGGLGQYAGDLVQGHEGAVKAAFGYMGNQIGQSAAGNLIRKRDDNRTKTRDEGMAQKRATDNALESANNDFQSSSSQAEKIQNEYSKAGLKEGGGVAAAEEAGTKQSISSQDITADAVRSNQVTRPKNKETGEAAETFNNLTVSAKGPGGTTRSVPLSEGFAQLDPDQQQTTLDNLNRLSSGGKFNGGNINAGDAVTGGHTRASAKEEAKDAAYKSWRGEAVKDNASLDEQLAETYKDAVNKFNSPRPPGGGGGSGDNPP